MSDDKKQLKPKALRHFECGACLAAEAERMLPLAQKQEDERAHHEKRDARTVQRVSYQAIARRPVAFSLDLSEIEAAGLPHDSEHECQHCGAVHRLRVRFTFQGNDPSRRVAAISTAIVPPIVVADE